MGILSLLPVLGIALLYSRRFGTTHSVALLHTVSAIVLVLYIGGLVQLLWWTALLVHLAGIMALACLFWLSRRDPLTTQLSMPTAVLVIATLLFWLVHGNNLYLYFDEYSHWGVYIKEMLALDAYWGADTNSMHPRYPPAAPLWQYLFNVFREPSEGTAYVAQFVLLITPLLVLFENIEWRRSYWSALVVALCLLALTNFGLGVSSLYVDHVIGAWFIGTILVFVHESPGLRRALLYALPLTMLALIKASSLAFALSAGAILSAVVAQRSWSETRRLSTAAVAGSIPFVVIALSAVLAFQAWGWRVDSIGATTDLEAVGGIVSGISGEGEPISDEQGAEITRRFLEVFASQQLSKDGTSSQFNAFSYGIRDLYTDPYRMSTLGFLVVFALWWTLLLTAVLRERARSRWAVVSSGVLCTAAAYFCALYMTYRYSAGEYGLEMSSYLRYAHIIVLPMLLVSFAPLLPVFHRRGESRDISIEGRSVSLGALLAVIGCIGLYLTERPYLRPIYEPRTVVPLRQELEPVTSGIRSTAGRSPVWIYLPNDYPNGFVGQLIQYLLTPTPARVERDASFFDLERSAVHEAWSGFDYVWIAGELEPEAAERIGELAGVSLENRLFAVQSDEFGNVSLKPQDPST